MGADLDLALQLIRVGLVIPQDQPIVPFLQKKLQAQDRQVADMAMLMRQLVVALRRAAPEHPLPGRALEYLQRNGLQGSILREGE